MEAAENQNQAAYQPDLVGWFAPFPPAGVSRRFLWLDGLRGVAATAVLFWHYQHFFAARESAPSRNWRALEPLHGVFAPMYDGGYHAVPLFWMLSGFVFATVYGADTVSTRSFVVNRFARLYPLHVLTLLIVAVLQFLALRRFGAPLFYQNNNLRHFALQLFMASAWRRWDQSFNGPIWSVSIEILVYALFWLVHRRLFIRGIALPLVLSLLFGALRWAGAVHLFFYCGQLFFAGCALLAAHRALAGGPRQIPVALVLLAIGVVLWWQNMLPLIVGMPLAFAGCVLLLSAFDARPGWRPSRLLGLAGDSTYGIYLWHVPIQIAALLVAPSIASVEGWAQSPWWLAGFVLLVIAVARVSFLLFERPLRDHIRQIGAVRSAAGTY